MNLIEESYRRLFPDRPFFYQAELEYNRRLSPFNANILRRNSQLFVHLNLQWKDIDDEIKIGLIQHLLLRTFKARKNTPNLELYNNFIRNIPLLTPKTKSDPVLEASFRRVNEQFFLGQLEQPNLQWGQEAFRKLASYNFHEDAITVSTIFQNVAGETLDYLMYHEMLHKHFRFKSRNGRSAFHTAEFKNAERLFPGYKIREEEITKIIRSRRRPKKWFWEMGF